MLKNAFIGKPNPPTDADLVTVLGSAKTTWDQFLAELIRQHGVAVSEWKCHSPKWGWSLRVTRKQRTIVWLSPASGGFIVLFILGAKAVQAVRATPLPQRVVHALDTAPKYPEGTGFRLLVKSPRMVAALMKLAAIKVAN